MLSELVDFRQRSPPEIHQLEIFQQLYSAPIYMSYCQVE